MLVVSPEVIKGVTVGEHVSLELDVQRRVVKIIQLAPVAKEREEEVPESGAWSMMFGVCQEDGMRGER